MTPHGVFCVFGNLFPGFLSDKAEAVKRQVRQPEKESFCGKRPAGEQYDAHGTLQFAVELLAGPVRMIEGDACGR